MDLTGEKVFVAAREDDLVGVGDVLLGDVIWWAVMRTEDIDDPSASDSARDIVEVVEEAFETADCGPRVSGGVM